MKVYYVRDWNELYETHESRKYKRLKWIPVPVKRDGEGYSRLVDGEHGAANLGAWLAILQIAATTGERGRISRNDGTPIDTAGMAYISRLKKEDFDRVLPLLCSPEINWLICEENATSPATPGESPATSRDTGRIPGIHIHKHKQEHKIKDKDVGDKAAAIAFPFNGVPAFFTACLWFNIRQHDTVMKKPNLQKWASEFDIMLRNDKQVTHGQILEIMGKATRDQFWHKNIKSPSSLRNQINKGTFTHFLEPDAKYQTNEEIVLEAEKCAEKTEAVFNGN